MTTTGAREQSDQHQPEVTGSLSPSRALDFKTCPLLYRLRAIDRLPERPSLAATRGTVVHAVLEGLYELPPADRTVEAAVAMVEPRWRDLLAAEPERAVLFDDDTDGQALRRWLGSARELVSAYFTMEDPRRIEPEAREQLVEVILDSGLRLRGYVDRLDVSDGRLQVVDYKTGAAPTAMFEGKALFQLKFYALVLWRTRGTAPAQLRLLYLKDQQVLTYTPDVDELARFERTLRAIWAAIDRARRGRDFRPNPGRLCDWCDYHAHCPAYGGTPPPFPEPAGDAGGHPVVDAVGAVEPGGGTASGAVDTG